MARPALSDGDRAYAAAAWAGGETQKSLATIFGYKAAPLINQAIASFICKYNPPPYPIGPSWGRANLIWGKATEIYRRMAPDDGWTLLWIEDRKALVPAALEAFKATL